MPTTPRQPDYRVCIKGEGTDWHRVGAAWIGEQSKAITITLDPYVSLPVGPGTKLTLYPADYTKRDNQQIGERA